MSRGLLVGRDCGSGGPRWVVLLHGAFLNREIWAGYEAMLGEGYRVLALDLPGHGSASGTPFHLDSAVDGVASAIGATCGGPAIVVGHSLGGYTGLALAARRPSLVRALALIGASSPPRAFTVTLAPALAALALVPQPISRTVLAAVVSRRSAIAWERVAAAGIDVPRGAAAVRALGSLDYWQAVRGYPGRLLVLNGSTDWLFRASEARTVLAARRGRLQVILGTGHLVPIERPADVARAIRRLADESYAVPMSDDAPVGGDSIASGSPER